MDTQPNLDLLPFQNIPRKKLDDTILSLQNRFAQDGVLNSDGAKLCDAFQRYWDSNIPVDYWFRDMHDFSGDKGLLKRYTEITSDIPKSFQEGVRICFAGGHGVGKTMSCVCILKRVVERGQHDALYVNLTDIIHVMTSPDFETKNEARHRLLNVDFLVIDEVDQRFMSTENAADLFGRILEPIIRTRIQNRMPLLLCTNSPNVVDSFSGSLKESIKSLMKLVTVQPVLGKDFRGNK
jgi:hypothetical protein